ncbi:LysR family transcriptional regulator [Vibrio taketomensis]|uniref:LysR family transcriptional regulator n=1 Tax=Vibrio taketomensis TaxID=2572923 RepID=UPI001E54AD20|nr:LysR family transcriptional regulator [Vibrio taketomensis]
MSVLSGQSSYNLMSRARSGNRMDTDNLKLFVKVAELKNISLAGKALGWSKSVASARLMKLESEVGVDLIHRSTRALSLSSEGKKLLPIAKEILIQEHAIHDLSSTDKNKYSGTLCFAASSTLTQRYIAPILSRFLDCYPNIQLEMKLSDQQIDLIEQGIDVALRNTWNPDSRLRVRRLAKDRRVLCASPNYLKSAGIPTSPHELSNHRLLMFKHTQARRLHNRATSDTAKFPPENARQIVSMDDGSCLREATVNGLGIAMSSIWNIQSELDSGKLVRVLPEYEVEDDTDLWIMYPKTKLISPKVRVFIDFLVTELKNLPS